MPPSDFAAVSPHAPTVTGIYAGHRPASSVTSSRGRILLLTTDTGSGHRSIASAIAKDFLRRPLPETDVVLINPFVPAYFNGLLREILDLYGPVIRNVPSLYGAFWRFLLSSRRFAYAMRFANSLVRSTFRDLIADPANRAIITTHAILPALVASTIRSDQDCVTVSVATDLQIAEPGYRWPGMTRYAAMTQEVANDLLRQGVSPERVVVAGHIIDRQAIDRAVRRRRETRQRLGLDDAQRLILLAGGREGAGHIRGIVDGLLAREVDAVLMVVCGTNLRLLRLLQSSPQYRSVKAVGWSSDFLDLLAAADLLVTKAGAVTIMEALAAGTKFVVTGYIGGQETGNVHYVKKHGLGVVADTVDEAVEAILTTLPEVDGHDARVPEAVASGSLSMSLLHSPSIGGADTSVPLSGGRTLSTTGNHTADVAPALSKILLPELYGRED
ncbi:MAG: MGDG synthase family glycosyltransferase [Sphingomonadaceae bacterium]